MKRIKKISCMIMLLLVILGTAVGFSGKTVQAAAGVSRNLRNNRVYKYDLDGNRKTDRIVLKTRRSGYNISGVFYVNGKKVYSLPKTDCDYAGYRIITLANGKRFIYAWTEGPNPGISSHRILQYHKGKMKTVCILTNLMKNYQGASYVSWYPNSGITVSGNSIKVRFVSMNWTTGAMEYVIPYKYKNGTLVRSGYSGYFSQSRTFKVSKQFSTYKKPGSRSRAFVVRKRENVIIDKYYIKKGKLYLQVRRSNGQTGWLNAYTDKQRGRGRSPIFYNGYYAN